MNASQLTYQHIGSPIVAYPRTDEGAEKVAGVIRWITITSDDVTVAIEEDEDSGAVEWTFPVDADLEVTGAFSGAVTIAD